MKTKGPLFYITISLIILSIIFWALWALNYPNLCTYVHNTSKMFCMCSKHEQTKYFSYPICMTITFSGNFASTYVHSIYTTSQMQCSITCVYLYLCMCITLDLLTKVCSYLHMYICMCISNIACTLKYSYMFTYTLVYQFCFLATCSLEHTVQITQN